MPQDQTQSEFLAELDKKNEQNPLEQSLTPETETVPEVKEESEEEKFNRQERRLRDKLQAERESSIALAVRLEALTEAQKLSREHSPSSYEEKASRIYGNQTPEAAAATDLLLASLKEAKEEAKNEAIAAIREEQKAAAEAVKKEEQTLESMVEDIEDDSRITLDGPTRKAFFSLLEKLSPKDAEGNVLQYADHKAVWEELQARKQPQNTRAKDLASRSMVKTGASPATSVESDATERWLKEQGIL